jgi:Flp pilus assembly protein TadG
MSTNLKDIGRRFRRNTRGAAAAEFVLWLSAMTLPIINVIDVGFYAYQRMQVETAAGAAVNAAWSNCDPTASTPAPPPAIITCKAVVTDLFTRMQTAAQSTSLGTNVTLPLASISEGYYCATSGGSLTLSANIGTAASPPKTAPTVSNCTGSTTAPSDYIKATTTYTYQPLFANASILSLFGTTITKTAWMRLDK